MFKKKNQSASCVTWAFKGANIIGIASHIVPLIHHVRITLSGNVRTDVHFLFRPTTGTFAITTVVDCSRFTGPTFVVFLNCKILSKENNDSYIKIKIN